MARPANISPTGRERFFGQDEIIVSKTDPKGRITYANEVFLRVAGYSEEDVMGEQHNIVRHPHMPRCVFKLLWETLSTGMEIFAYVLNMARNGDHYWVFAHVTPSFGRNGEIVGYHSNRRVPDSKSLQVIKPFYQLLLDEENRHPDRKKGMEAAEHMLVSALAERKIPYEEFIFSF